MKIGLIDVDGHHFPNLALMRISAYHKAQNDSVEWVREGFTHYDRIYLSKVFSDAYSPDTDMFLNADEIMRGGTGYAISLKDGREVYNKAKDADLPPEIEKCSPDYTIYPQYDFALAMTTRGCPRGCPFCHVAPKEGRASVKVADVADFWQGQKHIEVLDPNITACRQKKELFEQYIATGAKINFNQGLDIRLLDDDDIDLLKRMRLTMAHFAWDNPNDDLEDRFRKFAERYGNQKWLARNATVYVLTNYDSTIDDALRRIYAIRDAGLIPYVTIYDKPHADRQLRRLQRWCNNRFIFQSCPNFENYR